MTTSKLGYVDALRGYAVLLVIASHAGNAFPQLPWPLRALTNFGFHGVQLFFVVSCYTLMLSWQARRGRDAAPLRSFFIRRAFRILPMYLLAAVLYGWLTPPGERFSWDVLLTTLSFSNGWHPRLLGTSDGAWVVVPGGWSITVEFTFYLLFPWLAARLLSLPRAGLALLLALGLGGAAQRVAEGLYLQDFGPRATDQFVYYWLPNQLAVFAVGFLAWHLVPRVTGKATLAAGLRRWQWPLLALLALVSVGLAFSSVQRTPSLQFPYVPRHVLASALFGGLLLVMSQGGGAMVNRAIVWLGRVSFSAYLLHFAVLDLWLAMFPAMAQATGVEAIVRCLLLLAATVLSTFALSWVSHRTVELPMIDLGHRVCARLNARK